MLWGSQVYPRRVESTKKHPFILSQCQWWRDATDRARLKARGRTEMELCEVTEEWAEFGRMIDGAPHVTRARAHSWRSGMSCKAAN